MTVAAAADNLANFLNNVSEPALIVGHSMGAQVTMLAHGDVPKQVLAEIVMDPAYGADVEERAHMDAWAMQIRLQGHTAVADFFREATQGMPPVSAARLLEDLHHTSPATIASYLRAEYVDADAIGFLPATALAASRRASPVHSVHSSQASAAREAALPCPPGSTSQIWSGHGHFLHLEDPKRFVAELDTWRIGASTAPGEATIQVTLPVN